MWGDVIFVFWKEVNILLLFFGLMVFCRILLVLFLFLVELLGVEILIFVLKLEYGVFFLEVLVVEILII